MNIPPWGINTDRRCRDLAHSTAGVCRRPVNRPIAASPAPWRGTRWWQNFFLSGHPAGRDLGAAGPAAGGGADAAVLPDGRDGDAADDGWRRL